jgi:hypothetical protein
MSYFAASLFATLQLLGFIFFAGAGHGWLADAISCLPLAPIEPGLHRLRKCFDV